MRYSSISAIGGFTDVNTMTGDYLLLSPDRCSGGESATLRTTVEDAPGQDGVLAFPPLNGAQIITLAGPLIITTAGDEAGYFAAQDTLLGSLKTALDDLRTAADTLTFSDGSLEVWLYSALDTSWNQALMSVTFSLVVDGV